MLRLPRALSALAVFSLLACGGSVWVQKGDELLGQERYDDAVEAYEHALRESPGDEAAQAGIAAARRERAVEIISRAERELDEGRFVEAMRSALEARAMPLDLDEVSLGRRIDRTIARVAANSESQVQRWLESERYLDAVLLAEQLLSVDETRSDWATTVLENAIAYFTRSAEEAMRGGNPGTAALRLSIAWDMGASIERSRIASAWAEFRGPNCFADPEVIVTATRRVDPIAIDHIRSTVTRDLLALQSRCGVGQRPLKVQVSVEAAKAEDTREKIAAAEPLPGVEIETEEVYYEEIPYTEVEEITTYDTRIVLIEHRDCAPRPGQRGCRTWTEEVLEEVPKTEEREVQKVRRERRTRPVQRPLPEDKVVRFTKTSVTRAAIYRGEIAIDGVPAQASFEVQTRSVDTSHDAVNERGVVLAADPLEVKSLDEVLKDADQVLEGQVRTALDALVEARSEELELRGARLAQEGKRLAAEEAYLAKLVVGGDVDPDMARFFDRSYGREVPEVMKSLLVALGRVKAEDREEKRSLFPNEATLDATDEEDESMVAPVIPVAPPNRAEQEK